MIPDGVRACYIRIAPTTAPATWQFRYNLEAETSV